MNEIEQTVIEMIAEQLGIQVESIKPEQYLREDLAMDDLHMIELIMGLEEEFEIEIQDEEFERLTTVRGIMDFILDA